MAENETHDSGRRRFITLTTAAIGGAGAVAAAVPFLASWQPSARAMSAGAPVTVNIGKLEPGALLTVKWRGEPIFVYRRTAEELATLKTLDGKLADPNSDDPVFTPEFAKNEYRSIKPEVSVLRGICTHLGCVPAEKFAVKPQPWDQNWKGGFFCPCHNSFYDMAGRVYKSMPAPSNLAVPPYHFIDESTIEIGVAPEGVA